MEAKDIKTMTYAEYKKQTNWIPRIAEVIDLEDFKKVSTSTLLPDVVFKAKYQATTN